MVGRPEQVLELQQAQKALIKGLMGTYKVKWGIMEGGSPAGVSEPKQVIWRWRWKGKQLEHSVVKKVTAWA